MYEENFVACDECGVLFQPKFAGATTCWSCWKDTPAGRAWWERKQRQKGAYQQYSDHDKRYNDREDASRYQQQQTSQTRTEYRDCPGFDLQMCRRLLQLCHPDKHDGSEASVKATQWLNDRMRELKGSK